MDQRPWSKGGEGEWRAVARWNKLPTQKKKKKKKKRKCRAALVVAAVEMRRVTGSLRNRIYLQIIVVCFFAAAETVHVWSAENMSVRI